VGFGRRLAVHLAADEVFVGEARVERRLGTIAGAKKLG